MVTVVCEEERDRITCNCCVCSEYQPSPVTNDITSIGCARVQTLTITMATRHHSRATLGGWYLSTAKSHSDDESLRGEANGVVVRRWSW